MLRRYWLAFSFVALAFVLALACYGRLPPRMAVHWNLAGEVDGWMPRLPGAFGLPLVSLLLTLLMAGLPRFRPAVDGDPVPRVYPVLVAAVAAFHLFLTAVLLLFASGARIGVPQTMGVGLGLLLAVVGNYMGKVPRNRLVGFRLPWTLASEEVWERTHRFAAPVMVAGGLCLAVVSFLRRDAQDMLAPLATLALIVVVPTVKSYLIWRDWKRRPENAQ